MRLLHQPVSAQTAGPRVLWAAIAVYWVLLGGTEAGSVLPVLRALNAGLAGVLIWSWIRRLPSDADAVDAAALAGLLGFLVAAVFGMFPRHALDAGTAAIGFVAALYLGRRAAADEVTRRLAMQALGVAGIALAVLFSLLWGSIWLRWLDLEGYAGLPPLTMALPLVVFRHVHVVAFTVVLLLPASILLWSSKLMRPLVLLGVTGGAFVLLASGSRTAWAAVAMAGAITIWLAIRRGTLRVPRRMLALAAGAAFIAVAAIITAGYADSLLDRLATLRTLGARSEILNAALALWTTDPITGSGPGSFVAALPTTGYFDTNAFAPRHADNAVVQLLGEGGLVAALPVLGAVALAGSSLLRGRSSLTATWAILFFGFTCLTDNPADTAALNALLVFWLAVALPPKKPANLPDPRTGAVNRATVGALIVIAISYGAITVADLAHGSAVARSQNGDTRGVRADLQLAVSFDPGNALFRRELGLLELTQGNLVVALEELRVAAALMPTDDVTLRALAITLMRNDRQAAALAFAQRAATLRPASASNLILVIRARQELDPTYSNEASILSLLEVNPLLGAAPSWAEKVASADITRRLLRVAASALRTGSPDTTLALSYQPSWLAAMAGLPPGADPLTSQTALETSRTTRAWTLFMACRVSEARTEIREAQPTEADSALYWFVRVAIEEAHGPSAERVRELAAIYSVELRIAMNQPPIGASPLVDAVQDRRLYGRLTIPGFAGGELFPTGREALAVWLADPFAAAHAGAPDSELAACG